MPKVVAADVGLRKAFLQPSGEQINRQRKPVHLGEQGYDERGESTEFSPVPLGLWLPQAESNEYENRRIYDDERPQPVSGSVRVHHELPSQVLRIFLHAM